MITCECGHPIDEHSDWGEAGCMKHMSTCDCGLAPATIEARYWARKMKAGLDIAIQALKWYINKYEEADYPISSDFAIEALERITKLPIDNLL